MPKEKDWQKPGLRLLVKLGSVIVHIDEYLSTDGSPYDLTEFRMGMNDPEVRAWLKEGTDLALLPRKRMP